LILAFFWWVTICSAAYGLADLESSINLVLVAS
jgi:hypothetical protein